MIELRAMSNIDSRKLFSPYFVGFILINKKQIDGLMIRGLKDHYTQIVMITGIPWS